MPHGPDESTQEKEHRSREAAEKTLVSETRGNSGRRRKVL